MHMVKRERQNESAAESAFKFSLEDPTRRSDGCYIMGDRPRALLISFIKQRAEILRQNAFRNRFTSVGSVPEMVEWAFNIPLSVQVYTPFHSLIPGGKITLELPQYVVSQRLVKFRGDVLELWMLLDHEAIVGELSAAHISLFTLLLAHSCGLRPALNTESKRSLISVVHHSGAEIPIGVYEGALHDVRGRQSEHWFLACQYMGIVDLKLRIRAVADAHPVSHTVVTQCHAGARDSERSPSPELPHHTLATPEHTEPLELQYFPSPLEAEAPQTYAPATTPPSSPKSARKIFPLESPSAALQTTPMEDERRRLQAEFDENGVVDKIMGIALSFPLESEQEIDETLETICEMDAWVDSADCPTSLTMHRYRTKFGKVGNLTVIADWIAARSHDKTRTIQTLRARLRSRHSIQMPRRVSRV
ncbi:hypothetical protein BOTBODRAFT_647781 [Botryobasidium botryosum FD-172 SS1]|uniref:Uncharacterized protein n=1 Tax=Botryobasidium botryosum (strain FD-172 SS1) TaxID=930990 RepID=A0A067M7L6_BOTB1|nr:hypothetical protein BOTBODRAFT_647781 [Botryobasidium botryosum FD-172 SS1]